MESILVSMGAEIGLGCWAFGGDVHPDQNQRDSVRTIHYALNYGITWFDTAGSYGKGSSEQCTGQQIRRFRSTIPRETVTIATKLMITRNTDPGMIIELVRRSIRRLCTDYIDICYIHWPVSGYDMRPVLDQLEICMNLGLVRSIGLSNFSPDELALLCKSHPIRWYQGAYSLLWRKPEEEIIPLCREKSIKFCAYSPLAHGLLAKKREKHFLLFCRDGIREKLFPLIDEFHETAGKCSMSPVQAAVLWAVNQLGTDLVLTGARTRRQLQEVLSVRELTLGETLKEYLEEFSRTSTSLIPKQEDNIFGHRW